MGGHRLGNGTEQEAKDFVERGLPPSWLPYFPWHYLQFAYWTCTFSYSSLDMSKKIEFDRRVNRIAPWMVIVMLWSSVLFYLLIVELVIIPQTHKDEIVFPYNASVAPTELEPEADTVEGSNSHETKNIDLGSSDGDGGSTEAYDVETHGEGLDSAGETKFLVVFLGIPGGKVNKLNLVFGVALIVLSSFITARHSRYLGGLPAMMVTFGVTSLISTKIFFWLSEPIIRYLFIGTRVLDSAILIMMVVRLKKFHTDMMWQMGSMFANFTAFCFSLTMMASESSLVLGTSILLPLWIILLSVPIIPLIRGSLSPREALFRKLEVWLVAIAPFCLAVLFNWWFHISWMGDIDIPKVSYKNTLVIYILGLLFGSFLLLLKHLPSLFPSSQTPTSITPSNNSFPWGVILIVLSFILHALLFSRVVLHHPLLPFLAQTSL